MTEPNTHFVCQSFLSNVDSSLVDKNVQYLLLTLAGSSPNFKFDSFYVGVMGTVGCQTEGTIRKMN